MSLYKEVVELVTINNTGLRESACGCLGWGVGGGSRLILCKGVVR